MGLAAECELLGNHVDRNTQHRAVGRDQGQEDAQRLIQGRTDFLEHDLHHLHESRNHEDKGDRLQEGDIKRDEEILVDEEGH